MDTDGWIQILIVVEVLLIVIKAFFAVCEAAVMEAADSKVKQLAEKNKKFRRLEKLISSPTKMMTSFRIGRVALDLMIGVATYYLLGSLLLRLDFAKFPKFALLMIVPAVICTIIVTALTEILPKKLIRENPEKFAAGVSGIVVIYVNILYPFGIAAYGLAALICRIFGIKLSPNEEAVTEEEIRMMVDAGNETGVIEESQREMINNIFDFEDVDVSDVMTHRKDIVAIEVNAKIGDIVYLAINKGYSRIPVYENNVDNIIGIIYVKDLLCLVGCERSEDFTIRQFMRKAIYVPETCMCSDAFETLTKEKCQCAIVVDEYGGTAGLVSMEDMLEEIVGNIQDEYDDEKADITHVDDNVYMISGDASPEDVEEEIGFSMPEDHNYDTMSAFIVDLLGRIPGEDETPSVTYEGVEFTVLLAEDNWISKIKAKKILEQPQLVEE